MTDQQNAPAPPPAAPPGASPPAAAAPPPPAPPATKGPSTSLLAGVSPGELMILAGSALILLGDLVFWVLTSYYNFGTVVWVTAVLSLILVLTHNRPQFAMDVPSGAYRLILIVLGALALVAGVRSLIFDLQFLAGHSIAAMYLLGALVFYVGVGLMAFGAFQLWRRRDA